MAWRLGCWAAEGNKYFSKLYASQNLSLVDGRKFTLNISRNNAELIRSVNMPESRKAIEATGSIIGTSTPEELAEILRRDMMCVAKAAATAGIKPE